MAHMELLTHITLDQGMFNLGFGVEWYSPSGLNLALRTGLGAPFLMHELLAFSARHLSFLHPERSVFYHHQAMSLQTHAISLFNSAWNTVDSSNCVALLLFSSVLGHHLLADTLAKRDGGGLDAFIVHYTHCIEMHRGVVTIAKSAWPLLMESELGPLLKLSSEFINHPPVGTHCHRVLQLVESIEDLGQAEKEACRAAINFLQVGLDAVAVQEEKGNQYQMIFSWTTLMAPEFGELLAAKRPEALIVLAYYALLLHHGRTLWQIGDAGEYIMGLIGDYLGPEWDPWLDFPRQQMQMEMNIG